MSFSWSENMLCIKVEAKFEIGMLLALTLPHSTNPKLSFTPVNF